MHCIGFKIYLAVFVVTIVRRGYLAEKLACSTAEGSGMLVGVHGRFSVGVFHFKKIRSEWQIYSKY
jgi:hypothetical protein